MATYQGVGISFGIGTITGSPIVGKLQTRDLTKNAEVEGYKDEDGATFARVFSDPNQDATFEYIVTGETSATAHLNAAFGTAVDPGRIITLTSSTAGNSAFFNGTQWSIEPGVKQSPSNNGAVRVTLPLKRFPGITATVA